MIGGSDRLGICLAAANAPKRLMAMCSSPSHAGRLRLDQPKKSWYVFFQIPWLPEYWLGRDQARAADMFLTTTSNQSWFHDVREVYGNAAQPGALTAMINFYRGLVRQRTVQEWIHVRQLQRPP